MNSAIIIGSSHHNSLGVIRSLGERGYGVEFINYSAKGVFDYVSKSKYIKKYVALNNIYEVYEHLKGRPYSKRKEVIISCADVVTEHLNLHYNQLSDRYVIPGVPHQGKMVELMDKTTMINMAYKRGIFSPSIWKLPSESESVTFPCITKCHVSSHGGKSDIVILKQKEDLYSFLKNNQGEIFAQAYISKKEEVQFIGCSLRGGEEVIIPGMSKIIRSQPNTNTGLLEYRSLDSFYTDIVERAKCFIKDCNYSGLFSFEIMRGEDDRIWFLEINFRNDGNAWCVTKSGINLPVIWLKACSNVDYHDEIRTPNNIIMMPELQDFKLVLQRKVPLLKWLKDWKRTDYFMEYDKEDKSPFFYALLQKFHLI